MKLIVLLITALVFVGCNKGKETKKSSSNTLVYCSEGSPSKLNPQIVTDGTSLNASARTVFNRLVEFTYGETTIEPGLAESWSISEDGLEYSFKLRKNAEFHSNEAFTPTRKFNADDVVFTVNRMRVKEHPYHMVGGGLYEYFTGMEMGKNIKDVVKIDDYTVKFVLNQPEAPFLANLAMPFMSMHSAEYGAKLAELGKKDMIDTHPIGTGPFIFKKYVKDTLLRFEANKSHYLNPPKVDKLVYTIAPDPSVRFQKLKTGECHFVTEPSPADLASMKGNADLKLMQANGLNVGYLALNTEKKPFDNKLVRQAIHLSLNRKSYIEAIYLGNADVAKNPIPPTMWSYNNDIEDYNYDPAKAKALLKEAGYENGFQTELWVLPVSRPYNPNGKKMGEMMQADLKEVGIEVKIVSYDWATYLDKSRKGDHQMIQLGWTGDNGDPDNFMNVLLGCPSVASGSNVSRFCHPQFNDLLQKAKRISNQAERTKLYRKAQIIFKDQAPWTTIAHSIVYRAMRSNIEGYKIDPFGGDYFHTVEMK